MKKKIVLSLGIVGLLALIALIGFGFYQYHKWTTPWGEEDQQFRVEIKEGMSAREIADLMVEKGVIDNSTMFLILADLRGFSKKLKAGEYQIKGTQSPYDVIDMFATGRHYLRSLVVPEGFTQLQIAERLEEQEICSKEDFLDACHTRNIFSFVIAQAPGGANAASEGILFPDTYFFIKGQEPLRCFDRMRRRFDSTWQEIYDEHVGDDETGFWWYDENSSAQKMMHEIVIMASIIEKEAKHDEDRPKMASVFVNRLKENMTLQADSTIHYILQDWSRSLNVSDLDINSPYNTYKNKGLPPAPICNPGKPSLEAALAPTETDFLYFITMKDGSARFAETHEEHVQLKMEMKRERDE